jgi:hypothetical protein
MSRFSPSDAALEGFRLTREQPLAVLVWAVVRVVYGVAGLAVMGGSGWRAAMERLPAMTPDQAQTNADALGPLLVQLAPGLLLMTALSLIFYAVAYTAVMRAILRPADKAFFYLRLSADELRQLGLSLVLFVLFFFYAMVIEIASSLLMILSKSLGPAALPVDILIFLAVAAAFVYPAVRLSIAPAMTFADGKITLFRALPLTRGQFWPMFGAYVLALISAMIIGLIAMTIFLLLAGAIGAAQGGGAASLPSVMRMLQADQMSLASLATPLGETKLVFSALLYTLGYVILSAPAAAIFRELTGRVGAPAHKPIPGQPWGQA